MNPGERDAATSLWRATAADRCVELWGHEQRRSRLAFDGFRAAMPIAEVVALAGRDHLAHVSAPEQLASVVADVVARVDGGRAPGGGRLLG